MHLCGLGLLVSVKETLKNLDIFKESNSKIQKTLNHMGICYPILYQGPELQCLLKVKQDLS